MDSRVLVLYLGIIKRDVKWLRMVLQQKQKILAWLGESESQNLRLPSECGKTQGEHWKTSFLV
jgi:hypothetical protein